MCICHYTCTDTRRCILSLIELCMYTHIYNAHSLRTNRFARVVFWGIFAACFLIEALEERVDMTLMGYGALSKKVPQCAVYV